jgi:hypothetical protein
MIITANKPNARHYSGQRSVVLINTEFVRDFFQQILYPGNFRLLHSAQKRCGELGCTQALNCCEAETHLKQLPGITE